MSKNQFEKLIEYVINDEDAKAKELFHQIVVSKSRQIYENIMQEDELEEDNAMGEEPVEVDTDMSEGDDMMGGSQSGDMIDDVETEESGMHEGEDDAEFDDEAESDGEDLTHDMEQDHDEMGGEEAASKSDVMDLADKLDELMAEFEHMMGGGDDMGGDDMGGMGDDGMGEIEVDADEFETEGMMENITLKQVHPKTTTHEEGDGKAGPVAFNAGQTGMAGRPVKAGQAEGGHHDTAAYKNTTKDLIGKVGNSPAQAKQDLKPATKPHLGQAAGVNTRTPFPRSGK
jgi:hypothetical protein